MGDIEPVHVCVELSATDFKSLSEELVVSSRSADFILPTGNRLMSKNTSAKWHDSL